MPRPVPPPPDAGDRVTLLEAAQILGVTRQQVGRYCKAGTLPARRFGKQWMILRRDLDWFAATPRPVGRPRRNPLRFPPPQEIPPPATPTAQPPAQRAPRRRRNS